jgi:hypothetical protein
MKPAGTAGVSRLLALLVVLLRAGGAAASCDPSTDPDRADIANTRAAVAAGCDCASLSHREYVGCAATIDLRAGRRRHLLSHEREGRDEVHHQARRREMPRPERRDGMPWRRLELLRRMSDRLSHLHHDDDPLHGAVLLLRL